MNTAITGRVLFIAAALDTAAKLEADAASRRAVGYTSAADRADAGAVASLGWLNEPPSVARLRAAVLLLGDVTDDVILSVTARARDDLERALNAVDNGII
jgi:hypothetical protein